jgi:RNA binding exosome subunit
MKSFASVTLSVFAKPEDDAPKLKEGLLALAPFTLEEEKLTLQETTAQGFNQRTIHIYSIILLKDRHVNAWLEFLLQKLNHQQRLQLVREAESRLDTDLQFFIRLDKDLWTNDRAMQLTDSGDCYHLKLHVAAFPARRDVALGVVTNIFK